MSIPAFDTSTVFMLKQEAVVWIEDKNVVDKKPFIFLRSSNDRFMVVCTTEGCCYKINVRKREDDLFHVSSYHEHTCTNIFAKLTTNWVRTKAKELLANNSSVRLRNFKIRSVSSMWWTWWSGRQTGVS